jgi:2'-5' RNA ligase
VRPPLPPADAAPTLRTFIAVELPPAVKQQVQARQHHLRQAFEREQLGDLFRWTHPDNLHLTLRFLGDTREEQRRAVEAALAALAAAAPTFHLLVQKLGAFPSLRKPNILWLDFGGDLRVLGPLQAQIERAAQAAGFAAEERAFAPHLTIARAQKSAAPAALARAGELLRAESAAPLAAPPPFRVEQIQLIRSDLRPSGPVYRPLAAFDLAAG